MITLNKLQRLSSLQAARLGVIKLAASRVCTQAPLRAEEPVEADISRLLLIGAVGAAALGTGSWLLRPRAEVLSDRIYPRDWRYVCEGQRFLLCAPKGTDKLGDWGRWGGYVLQLRKSPGTSSNAVEKLDTTNSLEGQVGVQRMLSTAIPRLFLSIPEIVSVPCADVRALDAHLLAARPQNQRRQRLDVHEEPGRVAKVLLLRKENLLDAWAPSLSLELSPGCGVKEIDGMPSRHSMAFQLANGKAEQDWNLTLFSKNSAECAGAISRSVLDPRSCNGCEVFGSGGRHIGQSNVSTRDELLQSLGLSLEEVAEAGAAILSSQDSVLDSLRRLQVFAAGNAERLAGQMLVELRKHRNESPDGPDVLLQTQHFQAALAALAKSPRSREIHENEALRLLSTSRWTAREVEAAQRWLSLFLLGRGAFHAKVLLNFVRHSQVGSETLPGPAARFRPLSQWLPDKSWAADILVRTTVVGLEPACVEEIDLCSGELETIVAQYQKVAAA